MLIIAHRGCYYDGYNQNTLRAFRRVFDEGARALEFDVQKTSDDHLVIVHDLELDEVSDGSGPVAGASSATIRGLLAGDPSRGRDAIPFLEELLDLAEEYPFETRPVLHLELKSKDTGIPAAKMVAQSIAKGRFAPHHFLTSSFIWDELRQFSAHCPDVDVALLAGAVNRVQLIEACPGIEPYLAVFFDYPQEAFMLPRASSAADIERLAAAGGCPPEVAEALRGEMQRADGDAGLPADLVAAARAHNAVSLNLWHQSVTPDIVARAHAAGLRVLAYTVNTPEDAQRMRDLGVDGFFTDFYNRFKGFFD